MLPETAGRGRCRLLLTGLPITHVCDYYCSTFDKAVRVGGGGEWRTCATRDVSRSVHWGCYYATALAIEFDPQGRCFGCRESDFALQRLVECRALETTRVRVVALR